MKVVKTIAALCFLAGIALVLVQPVLGAGDDGPAPGGRKEATPEASSEGEASRQWFEVTARYPKRCMRPARGRPSGLVAARRGSTAVIGFPDGRPVARIDVSGDVAWSPSGTFLAERGGRVFDQSGNPQGALFFEPREWQWSPVADCALATTEEGTLSFSIPDTKRKDVRLLNGPVLDFDMSPNGRRLAAVVEGRGLYLFDLRRRRVAPATEGPASIAGWFSNRSVLYTKSKNRGKLRYATGRGKTGVIPNAFAGGSLVRCGDRTLRVAVSASTNVRFAELEPRRGEIALKVPANPPEIPGFSSAACSPDGNFIAAATSDESDGRGPLVLLDRDGAFVRTLADGHTATPVWSAKGLMYVKFGKAGRGRLWLIAPGTGPRPTPYRVGAPTQYDWHVR